METFKIPLKRTGASVYDRNGSCISDCNVSGWFTREEIEANTEIIVTAVNSYEALKEQNVRMREILTLLKESKLSSLLPNRVELLEQIESALKS